MEIDETLKDKTGYLERMSKSLQEKLRIAAYIPEQATDILDVGCADGTITEALATLRSGTNVLGIDLSADFIEQAKKRAGENHLNLSFEQIYLRDLLARPKKYAAVLFTSVLHEFYSYGEGISSVLKALADAHELLLPEGKIIIRDMVLPEYTKHNQTIAHTIETKIRAKEALETYITEFEQAHGPLNNLHSINHFLLKYFYTDNWERECAEHYVPVTLEQYASIFNLLNMELVHRETYTIPYLREKWQADFGFTDIELAELFSTSILVARKK